MAQVVEINQVGKREDLRDFISIIDMKDKPLLGMLPKLPDQKNMLVNWQADAYATPISTGVADGLDVESFENAAANRGLVQNYGQKFRRTAMVGDLAENVSTVAGAAAGEMARSLDKKLEEISRDIEFAFGSDQDAQLETNSTTPYKTKGLGVWATTTGGSVLTVPAAFRTPSTNIITGGATLVEGDGQTATSFRGILDSIYRQYGKREDLDCVCGPTIKARVSQFTASQPASANTYSALRAYTADLNAGKVTTNITVYEGDFNTVRITPSLLLAGSSAGAQPTAADLGNRAYIFPRQLLGMAYNRPPRIRQLPDQGGGPRALVDAICCLVVKNPLILGKIST